MEKPTTHTRQVLLWLLLGLALGPLEWPIQLVSELGFQLQRRLWQLPGLDQAPQPEPALPPWGAALLVTVSTAAMLLLAWGPLKAGKGGGITPVLAIDRFSASADDEQRLLAKLSLKVQVQRLPLLLLTHLGGLGVGVESPSASLAASVLLALRRRCAACRWLQQLPVALVAVIGAGAGLGVAFRSPLLGVVYGLEELGRRSGLNLVLPTLLIAGSGSLLASGLGQPARLSGIRVGALPPGLWGWALGLTLIACLLGSMMVRLLPALAALVLQQMGQRRLSAVLVLSGALGTLALLSGGMSLNDGALSLAALLQGKSGGGLSALIWRWPATLLSLASGAPGGLMHDAMTLGALLVHPLDLFSTFKTTELAQLAAVGATAFFAAGTGTPIFCAVFVVTLQGDAALLPALLLVSALSTALGAPMRGQGWNESQVEALR